MNRQSWQTVFCEGPLGIRLSVWVVVIGFGILCMLPIHHWRGSTQNTDLAPNEQPQRRSWRHAKRSVQSKEPSISFDAASQHESFDVSEVEESISDRRTWIDDSPSFQRKW